MLTTVEGGKLTVTGAGKDLMVMDEKGDSVKVTIVDVMQSNGVILVVDKGIDAQLTRVNATSERVTVCIGARSIVSKRPGSSPKLPRVEAGRVPMNTRVGTLLEKFTGSRRCAILPNDSAGCKTGSGRLNNDWDLGRI